MNIGRCFFCSLFSSLIFSTYFVCTKWRRGWKNMEQWRMKIQNYSKEYFYRMLESSNGGASKLNSALERSFTHTHPSRSWFSFLASKLHKKHCTHYNSIVKYTYALPLQTCTETWNKIKNRKKWCRWRWSSGNQSDALSFFNAECCSFVSCSIVHTSFCRLRPLLCHCIETAFVMLAFYPL